MDMIGRSKDGYVAVEGVGTSPGFKELVTSAHDGLGGDGLDLHLAERPSDNSDQASFYDKNIPVLAFFTGLHEDYHMPATTWTRSTRRPARPRWRAVVRRLAWRTSGRPSPTRGAGGGAAAAGGRRRPHARATAVVLPRGLRHLAGH